MSTPRYREIAADLSAAIDRGDHPVGTLLPHQSELMERYGVSKETISKAIRVLEALGLVEAVRKRGTVVRPRPVRRRITRERLVYRDEKGYFFDPDAQGWVALAAPVITRVPAPWDIARLLDVPAGNEVLLRDRIMGDPTTNEVHQLAASYLPLDLVEELPVLEQANTGPEGIYARLEEAGHGPLSWYERITAPTPTERDIELLDLAPGVSVLQIIRTASDPAGKVCEINATRMNGEKYEIGYPLERHTT